MHRRLILALIAMAMAMPTVPAMAEIQPSQLVGSWNMISNIQDQNGRKTDVYGANPQGLLMFDSSGHFSLMIMRSDLPKFGVNNRTAGTPSEEKAVVQGSIAFYGTYSVSGNTLGLHIESSTFPNWRGTDQKRTISIAGDQLSWDNQAASGGGSVHLVYQRAK